MRRTRHTRKRIRHKRKHRRRRTRRQYKKRRKTRHRRGGLGIQVIGGYKENLIVMPTALGGGGKKSKWAISDYPPGFSKFTKKDKKQWKKMKQKHKKKHRKH